MPEPTELIEIQSRKFQKELSAGTVSLALLAVLGGAPEPMYGYQIAKRLEQTGDGVPPAIPSIPSSSLWTVPHEQSADHHPVLP